MPSLGTLTVNFAANMAGLSGIGAQMASALGPVGGALALTAAATIGVGVSAVKMAGDFQSGVTTLVTGAGESVKNIDLIKQGLLAMAVDTGTSTKQLIDGLFMIESAGYHGADGLNVLRVAAQGAKVGNADLGVTANALTTILTDYHMSSSQAAAAMNALTVTVQSGKTHLQDLASSMGSVLPLASSLGISFPQVAGAIAVMTNAGMDAQRASQNLANAIRSLAAPNAAAVKSMKEVGLSAQQVKDVLSTQGLAGAIQLIEDHVGHKFPAGSVEAVNAFKHIMGGATGYNVALMLGGKSMETYKSNIEAITIAMKTGGSTVLGWDKVQGDFNTQMDRAKAAVEVLMIKIGSALIPVITLLLTKVTPVILQFADWLIKSGALQTGLHLVGTVLQFIGSVIGGVVTGIANVVKFFQQNQVAADALAIPLTLLGLAFLILAGEAIAAFLASIPAVITGFIAGAAAAWTFAAGVIAATWPFLLVGVIVGAVIALIILAFQHWNDIVKFFQGVWGAFTGWLGSTTQSAGNFFTGVWNNVVNGLKAAWNVIVNVVKVAINILIQILFGPIIAIANLFIWLYQHNTYFQRLCDAIVNFFKAAIAWIQHAWTVVTSWLSAQWTKIASIATVAWSLTTGAIQSAINKVSAIIQVIWTFISGWITDKWNQLAGFASAAWQAVSTVFSNIWNTYIAGPLGNLWTQFTNWFNDLSTAFKNAGANFINMLINGITSGVGAIWNAVCNIANTIWTALGFHSPPKGGPLADSDKYMPRFVDLLATGLISGVPKLTSAVNTLVSPLAVGTAVAASHTSSPGSSTATSGKASSGDIHVYLQMDGQTVAHQVFNRADGIVRAKLGPRGRI